MVQQTQQSLNQFIGLLGQLYQLPHPQTPNLPLASDPNLDITGFLYRSLEFLRKELSYSGRYKSSSTDSVTKRLSDADRKRAQRGEPTRDERRGTLDGLTGPAVNTSGFGSGGFGSGSQSMAAGIPSTERKPEYAQPIPGPGTVLGLSDTDASGAFPGAMGFDSATTSSPVF